MKLQPGASPLALQEKIKKDKIPALVPDSRYYIDPIKELYTLIQEKTASSNSWLFSNIVMIITIYQSDLGPACAYHRLFQLYKSTLSTYPAAT